MSSLTRQFPDNSVIHQGPELFDGHPDILTPSRAAAAHGRHRHHVSRQARNPRFFLQTFCQFLDF